MKIRNLKINHKTIKQMMPSWKEILYKWKIVAIWVVSDKKVFANQ